MPLVLNCLMSQFRGDGGYYHAVQKNIGVGKKQKPWEDVHHIKQVRKIVKHYDETKTIAKNLNDAYMNKEFKTGKNLTLKNITFDFSNHALDISANTGKLTDANNQVIEFPENITLKDCQLSGGKMRFFKGKVTATGLLTELDVLGEAVGIADNPSSVVNALGYKARGVAGQNGAIASAFGPQSMVMAKARGAKAYAFAQGSFAFTDRGTAYSRGKDAVAVAIGPLAEARALAKDAVAFAIEGGIAIADKDSGGIAFACGGDQMQTGQSRAYAEKGGVAFADGGNAIAVCQPGGIVFHENQYTNLRFSSDNYSAYGADNFKNKKFELKINPDKPQLLTYIFNAGAYKVMSSEHQVTLKVYQNKKDELKKLMPFIDKVKKEWGQWPSSLPDCSTTSNQNIFFQARGASVPDLFRSNLVLSFLPLSNAKFEAVQLPSVNQGGHEYTELEASLDDTSPSMVPANGNLQRKLSKSASALFSHKTRAFGVVGGEAECNVGSLSGVHQPEHVYATVDGEDEDDTYPRASTHSSSQRRLSSPDCVWQRVQVSPVNRVSYPIGQVHNFSKVGPYASTSIEEIQQRTCVTKSLITGMGKEYPGYSLQENDRNHALIALNVQGNLSLKGAQATKPLFGFQQEPGFWQAMLSGGEQTEPQQNNIRYSGSGLSTELEEPFYRRGALSTIMSCSESGDWMGEEEPISLESNVDDSSCSITGCVNLSSYSYIASDGEETLGNDGGDKDLLHSQPSSMGLSHMKMGINSFRKTSNGNNLLTASVWFSQSADKSAAERVNEREAPLETEV